MSDLYRINEVPDPTGQLADLLSELIDNSALVEVTPNIEAAAEELRKWFLDGDSMYELEARRLVNLALTPPGDTQ